MSATFGLQANTQQQSKTTSRLQQQQQKVMVHVHIYNNRYQLQQNEANYIHLNAGIRVISSHHSNHQRSTRRGGGRAGQLTERTWRRFIWILVFLSKLHSESGARSRRKNHNNNSHTHCHLACINNAVSVHCSYTQFLPKLHTTPRGGG